MITLVDNRVLVSIVLAAFLNYRRYAANLTNSLRFQRIQEASYILLLVNALPCWIILYAVSWLSIQ